MCGPHYQRAQKYGDPEARGPLREDTLKWLRETIERLEREPTDDCVVHPFHKRNGGYGFTRINGRKITMCRAVLVLTGRQPTQHTLHSCDNPPCVNPRHVRAGTALENAADRERSGHTAHGAQIPQFRLSDDQVREIRASLETHKEIAARLGVHPTTVSQIRRGLRRQRVQ